MLSKQNSRNQLDSPPYPYGGKYKPPIIIDGHYYCIDSKKTKLENIKKPWFNRKWLYNHSIDTNKTEFACTDNLIRHKMNNNSKKYGDIGITKIKHYKDMDLYNDVLVKYLITNNLLPRLNFKPNNTIQQGLNIISPDFAISRFSRNTENRFKDIYGSVRLILWDTETTGISKPDRIVQIACKDITTNVHYCQTFNPDTIEMSAGATAVTGITNDDLKDKPKFIDKIDEFNNYLLNSMDLYDITIMVAHNSNFDETMLKKEYNYANKKIPSNIIFIDSLDMFRTWLSGEHYNINPTTKKPVKATFKLSTNIDDPIEYRNKDLYYRYFGCMMSNAHDAMGDVEGLWNIIQQFFLNIWGRNEDWFMIKKMLELHYISEILDIPYINSLFTDVSC